MFAYWFLFILPLIATLNPLSFNKKERNFFLLSYFLLLIFFIGFRHEVGGDWGQYEYNYKQFSNKFDIYSLDIRSDYGFNFISWLFFQLQLSYNFVNFFLSIFFVYSLYVFTKREQDISLALVISFPVLILVMGMGFTRQGTALAFIMIALANLIENRKKNFFLFFILAISFHKSAILLLILYLSAVKKIKLIEIFLFLLFISLMFLLTYKDMINLYINYLGSNSSTNAENSQKLIAHGAYFRISINAIAGIIMLIFRNELSSNFVEKRIFISISIFSILSLFLIQYYSVFIDRINYYFLPLQIIVFSRFHTVFKFKLTQNIVKYLTISVYILILIIWLNFSINSHAWIPYKNLFFN